MENTQWKQLVELAIGGDESAYENLYKESQRSVYFICIKMLGDENNAKDAAQDAYLTAFSKLSELDDGSNFLRWINGIAANKCRAFFRKRQDESLDEQMETGAEFTDGEFIPEEYVMDKERRKIIMCIIDTELSDVQRQTVILYYYCRMSIEQIAKQMNCPEGTVKWRLSASKEKIRNAVLEYEKKNDDRLHIIVPVPILTKILREEAQQTNVPKILWKNSKDNSSKASDDPQNNINNSGGSGMTKALTGKIIAGIAAVVIVGGVITGAVISGGKDESDSKPKKNTTQSSAADPDRDLIGGAESSEQTEEYTDNDDDDDGNDDEPDYSKEVDAIGSQTDIFLTSIKEGDLETFVSMLSPESEMYEFFSEYLEENNSTENMQKLFKLLYGDMIWARPSDFSEYTAGQLEDIEDDEDQPYIQIIMTTANHPIKNLEYQYYLTLSGNSQANEEYVDDDGKAYEILRSTVNAVPVNDFPGSTTLIVMPPNDEGKVYFDMDDSYDLDMSDALNIEKLHRYSTDDSQVITTVMNEQIETDADLDVGDAQYCKYNDFFVKYIKLVKEKKFTEAWELIKPYLKEENKDDPENAQKGYHWYDTIEDYDSLTEEQKKFVDDYCLNNVEIFDVDYRIKNERRTVVWVCGDKLSQDSSYDDGLAEWYKENKVKDFSGAVYFGDRKNEIYNYAVQLLSRYNYAILEAKKNH